ncbi:MAG TPA: hypothetical protein PLD47_17300 [Aggregatilineales bacterium]|nr:hypothetical protein [Anaerolineales bacterium]HRE49485.1 hypothetical protein [Aggregatilineales bacterium]
MDFRSAAGFLGTTARLGADLTVVAYILLIVPGMIIGFIFARRKMFVPHHKFIMTTIVIVNWVLIGLIMAISYSNYVRPSIPEKLGQPFFLTPTVHLFFGGLAQILGTILVIRMWFEYQLPKALRFEPIKPAMRLTLACWLIAATLGILTYITWYGVPFSGVAAPSVDATPAATQEADPAATGEATQPPLSATGEATSAPAATGEATSAPAATDEATSAPAATAEATPEPAATAEATKAP